MRKFLLITAFIALSFMPAFSQEAQPAEAVGKAQIVLLVSEQNIDSPRHAWWASEVDLSATEAALATKLLDAGFEVIDPASMSGVIKKEKAFRMLDVSDKSSVKMASLAKADYVLLGKAVASSGGNVPQSSMRSCFANITAKLINVRTGKVIAYLDASGNSAHMDVITGGREALVSAGQSIGIKMVDKLNALSQAKSQ
ncbi:MAG: CsgG/HfaB family protein [Candidatus Omnitrophica bacterium]|nr:CsgG/HfaB family protein [Candidatus Omnitrophota bacterium]